MRTRGQSNSGQVFQLQPDELQPIGPLGKDQCKVHDVNVQATVEGSFSQPKTKRLDVLEQQDPELDEKW